MCASNVARSSGKYPKKKKRLFERTKREGAFQEEEEKEKKEKEKEKEKGEEGRTEDTFPGSMQELT